MPVLIGLDAGHGLKTAGKQTYNGKFKEWELNNKVVKYIVEYLEDYDVDFVFTDGFEGATDEALTQRYNAYIKAGVKVFVSIHHNAYKSKLGTHTGVEVFVDKNFTQQDMKLATCIYPRLVKNTGLKGRGIKKENWLVINQNKIPAILCEGGFMDSSIDYPVITSEKGQRAYAKAVSDGLIEYLNLKKKKVVKKTFKPYLVKVDKVKKGDVLNVRKKPDAKSKVQIKLAYNDHNKYTIIDEKVVDGQKWGLMKAGEKNKDRWINLYFTKKV